jgi:cyclophilin family peptidyl-prolyl cis-trans isomerase
MFGWIIACAIVAAPTLVLVGPHISVGQEAPTAGASETPGFVELRTKSETLTEQAKKLIEESRTATPDRKTAIRKEYQSVLAEHAQVIQQLGEAAKNEYTKAPKENAEAAQLLADLAADLLRRDRYEAALELLKPLIENKSDVKSLYATAGVAAFSINDFDSAKKYFDQARETNSLRGEATRYVGLIDQEQAKWEREQELREKEAQADDLPRVRLTTTKGDLVIELFENEAPNTVANFISLVEQDFYDGLPFHRVLPGFMAQGGDPKGDGTGGPGYTIKCECHKTDSRMHFRGSLSMAHAGRDTGGSQFFLTFRPTPHLDKQHTAFGRVIQGMELLPEFTRRDPSSLGRLPTPDKIITAEVLRKRDHEYQPEITPEEPSKP